MLAEQRKSEQRSESSTEAAALLTMESREAMVLNIEGANRYVSGKVGDVPKRLRIGVTEESTDQSALNATAV